MNYKQSIAMLFIELIIVMPIYSAMAIAQPEVQPQAGPYIIADIPRYYNRGDIDITGTVTPYSIVQLYVDSQLERMLSDTETGNGKFEFYDVMLGAHGTTKTIRISARDQAGNTKQEDFVITVDKEKPEISIEGLPELAPSKKITVNATVNENATVNVYVAPLVMDTTKPAKIIGLKNTTVQPNLIELEWHESNETDFDRYVIYRADVGAIATTTPANYNSYSDVLVNSNETYAYSIAAMDKAGNIGDMSDSITVTIPDGGLTAITSPPGIDPTEDLGLQTTLSVSGDFNFEIDLEEDGVYSVRLQAIDGAGNKKSVDGSTVLDTKPPTFEDLKPKTGTRIYENYAKELDLEGKTKPYTKVKLFVGSVKSTEDFSTISDSTGRFRFDDINIRSYFRGSLAPQQVGVGELETRYDLVEEERGRHARTTKIFLVAEDRFGRTADAELTYHIVTCWEGAFDWDAMPLLAYQSPTWLSVERLSEGTEAIYFFFNFTYLGDGKEPRIDSINFQKACDDFIKKDPRYNISCEVLPSSCTAKPNDDNTMWYIACDLGRYEGFDNFMETEWQGFFSAIKNEMIFPFRIMLRYSHLKGTNKSSEFQTFCKPVTYVVDSSKVDFRDVLPDWLLYDAVEALNSTVSTLNEWQESIKEVLEYLGTGCIVGFGLRTVAIIYKRFVCYWESFQESLEAFGKALSQKKDAGEAEEEEKACPKDQKGRDKLSDKDLERDCKRCASGWDFERRMYVAYRFLCDRVFCHDAPARWTEDKKDSELFEQAVKETKQCAADDRGLKGQPLTQTDCSTWKDALDKNTININNAGEECYQARVMVGKVPDIIVFVKVKNSEEGSTNIHHFTSVSLKAPRAAEMRKVEFYAKRVEGSLKDSYYTANVKTCKEICGKNTKPRCIKSSECIALNAPEGSDEKDKLLSDDNLKLPSEKKVKGQDKPQKIKYSSRRASYTRDCVFGNGGVIPKETDNFMDTPPDPNFPGDTLEDTKECCCVSESAQPVSKYYQTSDYGIEEEKKGKAVVPKWSYRYYKIKFATGPEDDDGKPTRIHTAYNPDRYVSARDFPACFGQNHLLNLKGGEKLKLDPFKSHLATFQCLCVSGVYNRLKLLSNILGALQNCLLTVRTTGTADAGVCKELFSRYVCSFIWQIISFLQTGCLPWGGQGADLSKSESGIANAVRGGVGAIFGGIAESAADLGSEYGNAQLNNLIGVGEGAIVRKICMAAFGFDWDFELEDILDAAYSTPFATLVQAVGAKREYLTYDPTNGQSKYEYRASWLINPGCDLENYNVFLSCISRNEMDKHPGIDCSSVQDPEGVNCDCINLDGEKRKPFYDGRDLKQNVLEDTDHHDVISSQNRFDHLKFVLKPDQEIPKDTRDKCFPEKHDDGVFYFPIKDNTAVDVASCYVDITTGQFNCLVGLPFFKTKGTGYFVDLKLNEEKAENFDRVKVGDPIRLTPTIWKAEGPDLCLYYEWIRPGGIRKDRVIPAELTGTQEYPPIIIEETAKINNLRMYRVTPNEISKGKMRPNPLTPESNAVFTEGETMVVTFYDDDADDSITISRESMDDVKIGNSVKESSVKESIALDKYWKDGKFVLSKVGISFEVKSVTLPAKSPEGKQQSEVTFEVVSRKLDTMAKRITKTLRVSLVHLKPEKTKYTRPEDCNKNDKVRYQGNVQKKEYKITIGTDLEGACGGDGTQAVPRSCECSPGTEYDDCGVEGSPNEFCYANIGAEPEENTKSCHPYPRCPETIKDLTSSIACDCDADGKVNDKTEVITKKKCEGVKEEKYCWDYDKKGERKCTNVEPPALSLSTTNIEGKITARQGSTKTLSVYDTLHTVTFIRVDSVNNEANITIISTIASDPIPIKVGLKKDQFKVIEIDGAPVKVTLQSIKGELATFGFLLTDDVTPSGGSAATTTTPDATPAAAPDVTPDAAAATAPAAAADDKSKTEILLRCEKNNDDWYPWAYINWPEPRPSPVAWLYFEDDTDGDYYQIKVSLPDEYDEEVARFNYNTGKITFNDNQRSSISADNQEYISGIKAQCEKLHGGKINIYNSGLYSMVAGAGGITFEKFFEECTGETSVGLEIDDGYTEEQRKNICKSLWGVG